jgi:hypothetical protein
MDLPRLRTSAVMTKGRIKSDANDANLYLLALSCRKLSPRGTFDHPACYVDAPYSHLAMPRVLYARPETRTLRRYRRYLGPIAVVVAVCSSALIVADTFDTRLALASYVQVGLCGTPLASLEMRLYDLPAMLFVPCALAMGVSQYLHYGVAASRVSLCVAVLGWATCAFVG